MTDRPFLTRVLTALPALWIITGVVVFNVSVPRIVPFAWFTVTAGVTALATLGMVLAEPRWRSPRRALARELRRAVFLGSSGIFYAPVVLMLVALPVLVVLRLWRGDPTFLEGAAATAGALVAEGAIVFLLGWALDGRVDKGESSNPRRAEWARELDVTFGPLPRDSELDSPGWQPDQDLWDKFESRADDNEF